MNRERINYNELYRFLVSTASRELVFFLRINNSRKLHKSYIHSKSQNINYNQKEIYVTKFLIGCMNVFSKFKKKITFLYDVIF